MTAPAPTPSKLRAPPDFDRLRDTANSVRRAIVTTVHHAGAGHVGGPLSATDVLTVLYFHEMRIDPQNPTWEDRDRFVFSKGHSSVAIYAVLAERGYFPKTELKTFDQLDSRMQGHPDMALTPGLDMSTGSLGQGLSPGLGMALAARLRGKDYRTYVMIGDAFYIISGHAQYFADGDLIDVEPGDTVYCPAGTEHTFFTGDEMLHLFWLIGGQWSTDLADIKAEVSEWHEVDATTGWHLG